MIDIKKAIHVGSQTLVGSIGNTYPRASGNCFGLCTEDKEYRIGNMNIENLRYLLKQNIVDFPIDIDVLDSSYALVVDERVPKDFLDSTVCTICFPYKYWTKEQQEDWNKKIESGEITDLGNGLTSYKFNASPKPLGYTVEAQTNIVFGKLTEITIGDMLKFEENKE